MIKISTLPITKSKITKSDILYLWCKDKKIFSSADVERYGVDNYYLRAKRTVQDWASPLNPNPYLRRIPDDEAVECGLVKKGNQRIAWFEFI